MPAEGLHNLPPSGEDEGQELALQELLAAVKAADEEEDDTLGKQWELVPEPDPGTSHHLKTGWHQLERPLQVRLQLADHPHGAPITVDVLEHSNGMGRLTLALPVDLELREGQRGELQLLDGEEEPHPGVAFEVSRVEAASRLRLAEVVLGGVG